MIYTITFNPAVDYVVYTDELQVGKVNRSKSEEIYFGGKGINVSMVLNELGIKSKAMGFVAGFTGAAIEKGLTDAGIETDFVHLNKGFTRINVKIKSHAETELNGQGPEIPTEKLDELFDRLDGIKDGDGVILAGSIPSYLPSDIYERILERLKDRNIRAVVDATDDLLVNVLKYRPFLMSMAGDGAILLDEFGKTHVCGVCKGQVKNSVGAGDSMVAGFLAGCAKGDYEYALKLGTAAGGATAFSDGLAKKDDIFKLLRQL